MEGFDVFFGIISIVIFSQSLRACDRFLKAKDPGLFPATKSWGTASKVFFAISCFRLGFGIITICSFMGIFSIGMSSPIEGLGTVVSVFAVSLIFNVITFIIGVMSVMKHKEAQKLYSTLTPRSGGANTGFNSAPYGNGASNNGTNYANPGNTGYNGSNTGAQGSYQTNVHTNDPTQLRSSTGDQTPFEAPPPNYNSYNYSGNYQQGRPAAPYHNPQQRTPAQPANNPPSAQNTANGNNAANAGKAEPKQYVSQMPEVTPFPKSQPAAASTPPNPTAPQKPVVPVVVPVPPEIKREVTVRCKHCGVSNKEGDKFCTFCGKSLSE